MNIIKTDGLGCRMMMIIIVMNTNKCLFDSCIAVEMKPYVEDDVRSSHFLPLVLRLSERTARGMGKHHVCTAVSRYVFNVVSL